MCLPDCTWMDSHEEDLFPFDAGTDSGISYNVGLQLLEIYLSSFNY